MPLSRELAKNSVQKVSNLSLEDSQNSPDKAFGKEPFLGTEISTLLESYLGGHDFSKHTRRAVRNDLKKFSAWFVATNKEQLTLPRITVRDVMDFRKYLNDERKQAVASINRALVSLRRFFDWLVKEKKLTDNPAAPVKELRRQRLSPKGLERAVVRRLLREVELRKDQRASAVFGLLLYTGCRVGDLVLLEVTDVKIGERSGSVEFRFGKGGKQRTVPLPLEARRVLQAYLETRPPVHFANVFIGERGPLTDDGVRSLCKKYGELIGAHLHPHVFRHTMAKQFLADNGNDLVSLAQILGHESLNTTSRYSQRSASQLGDQAERVNY